MLNLRSGCDFRSIVLVCAVLCFRLAVGVLVAYGVCMAMFWGCFRCMSGRWRAGGMSPDAVGGGRPQVVKS